MQRSAPSARATKRPVLIAGLIAACIVAVASLAGWLDAPERASIDWRFANARWTPESLSDQVALVAIDDAALVTYGRWSSWPRTRLATVIDELADHGAKTIALDLILNERSTPEPDAALADAIARAGNVVLGVDTVPSEDIGNFAHAQAILPGEGKSEFARRVAGANERTGDYPQRIMYERAYEIRSALELLRKKEALVLIDPQGTDHPRASEAIDKLPLTAFAEGANGAGYVSVTGDIDPDLAVRSMSLRKATGITELQSLAGAAFSLHRALQFDDPAVPDQTLVIDWPTSDSGWLGAFPDDSVFPIGLILELPAKRTKIAEQRVELESLAKEIAYAIGYDDLTDAVRGEVVEEVAFQLEAAEGIDPESLSPEERDALALYQHHRMLSEAITEGQAKLDEAAARLARTVSGKLVFLGWAATGTTDADVIRTPLAPNTPGVFAHCVLADMLLTDRRRHSAHPIAAPAGALLLGALCACAVAFLPAAALGAIVSAAMLGAFFFAAGIFSFNELRLVLPLAAPLGGGVGGWAASTAAAAFISQRDRARITRQFKARVDPALVDRLVNDPQSVSVSGVQREATIIFLDIAGFTTVAETLDSQRTVTILNRFMREMTRALTANGAYVNKFLGDGLMAFFSAFVPDPEQAPSACRAALQCKHAIDTLNDIPDLADTPTLSARIGIATGLVTIGDCGSPPELNDYTAIGDAVNLAARLESAAKQFGVWSLIDQRTRNRAVELGFDASMLDPAGRAIVVGRTEPTMLYTLPGPGDAPEPRAARTDAIDAFLAGDNALAAQRFEAYKRQFGPSKLARLYLSNINAPEPPTDGAIRLTLK